MSVIAVGAGYRLVTNRDVARARAEALPPSWHDLASGGRGLWPTDAAGGGTWVGVNDLGLTLCLLNRNPEPPPPVDPAWRSRGALIPRLLECADAPEAMDALAGGEDPRCAPFRLLGVDLGGAGGGVRVFEAVYEGGPIRVARHPSGGAFVPACLVSSGLGDSRVGVRLPLFGEMVGRDPTPEAQDAFHRHRWAERPEVSCLMSRAEARTVSITTVEVGAGQAPVMGYEPVPG